MCRFVIYKGTAPVQLSHLLTRPCHSIINQAFDSRLRLDRRRPINGDGFGVDLGWYDSTYDEELGVQPCIFTSVTPAWNNVNLTRLTEKIKSPLVFAHVRATTAGSLSLDNCHPWQFGKIMVSTHHRIHGCLALMSYSVYAQWRYLRIPEDKEKTAVQDSQWAFALLLSKLPDPNASKFSTEILRQAMLETIADINEMTEAVNATEPSLMNFCVTDGESVIATRYINSRHDEAASLWFSSGTTFSEYADGGHYKMSKMDKRENIILIASEPLTFEKADWMEIRTNHMVVITPKMNLLQVPIIDKYFVRPTDPEWSGRDTDFAAGKARTLQRYSLRLMTLTMPPWFLWSALSSTARLSTVLQILIYLPLTLSTLSTSAFLLLSLLLFGHSLIHGTLTLVWGSSALSVLQVPAHPFLLLVCFNAFSHTANPWLITMASWWGRILHWSSPGFIVLEGMSSLLVSQKLGQVGKELVGEGESYQFGLLIGAAAAYVTSAWWIVASYPTAASSPLSSTLLGAAVTAFVFLTCIGFVLRRTNVIESSGLALFLAYNVWLCGVNEKSAVDTAVE
ncbi:hypothetical protein EUX98_g139 [Antrodiella citrinella]|uniref:Glutamine amidotransferase type-2 domain-containing protein n=1 Tax=Antrodiella citrinella TaxID=2447956 RepID=A0A4S4N4M9_9APHY|nr:hypothetical protein EUX98_g139 [Antrodiella citrinella]